VTLALPEGHTTALFVLKGAIRLGNRHPVRTAELAVMERRGSQLVIDVEEDTTLLLLNGAPLDEPIVGHGPFVMNTQEEIVQAINDYNSGRFGQIGR
jgi:quercetin 2,3-dioxygenase